MKALIIADTHCGMQDEYLTDDCDLVIMLGDHSITDIKIVETLGKPIYRISGNHDVQYDGLNTIDFHNKLIENNVSFVGWQGSSMYKHGQVYGYTQKESLVVYKTMPKATILFAHDGEYQSDKDDAHCGLKGITKYLKKKKPVTFIHGHLHNRKHYTLYNTDCYCTYGVVLFEFDDNGKVVNTQTIWKGF